MKNIHHVLVAVILAFVVMALMPSEVRATQLTISGNLTDEQQAKIIYEAERLAAEHPVTASEVREWAELGTALGEGLAAAAGSLGVQVNDFADTRVGTLTMVVIIWRYMGGDLVGLVFGSIWLMLLIPTWLRLYRRTFVIKSITYCQKGEGPRKVIKFMSDKDVSSEGMRFFYMLILVFIVLIGVIPILTTGG